MSRNRSLYGSLIAVAACVIVISGLRAAQSLVVPFLLAAFLSIILAPLLHWMQSKGIGTPVALLVIISGCILVGAWLCLSLGGSVNELAGHMSDVPALIDRKLQKMED